MGEAFISRRAVILPPSKESRKYGIRVADSESSPVMERLYESVGMVANVGTSLTDVPSNDFDNVYPFNKIITETISGRVMIRIPKFYVRREHYQEEGLWYREWTICESKFDNSYVPHEMFLKGNVQFTNNNAESDYNDYVWVSKYETSSNNQSISAATVQVSQTRATMRTNAKAIGDGWTIIDIITLNGLWILFHIVFATRNSQSLMKGNYSGAVKATGLTTGAVASCVQISNTAMSFYGIENLYSNTNKFIDGINVNARRAYVSTKISDFVDSASENYRTVGYVNGTSDGYITTLGYDPDNKFAEFPIATGGSGTTYYCDYYSQAATFCLLSVSGHWTDNANYGMSHFVAAAATTVTSVATGSRLAYRPF